MAYDYSDFLSGLGVVTETIRRRNAIDATIKAQKQAREMDLYLESLQAAELEGQQRAAFASSGIRSSSPVVNQFIQSQQRKQGLAAQRIAFNWDNLTNRAEYEKKSDLFAGVLGMSSVFQTAQNREKRREEIEGLKTALALAVPKRID